MNPDDHECQRLREALAPFAEQSRLDPALHQELQAALSIDDFGLADGMRLRGYITDFLSSRLSANDLVNATVDLRRHAMTEQETMRLGTRPRLTLDP